MIFTGNEIILIYWIISSELCGFSWICGDDEVLRGNKGKSKSFDDVQIVWLKSYSGGVGCKYSKTLQEFFSSWMDVSTI